MTELIEAGARMVETALAIIHHGTALALLWCLVAGVGR